MPHLLIVGPQGDEQVLELAGNEFFLGRDPQVSIVLEDRKVSRKHARIFVLGGGFYVEDLNSANGVLCQGAPLTQAQRLVNGSEVEIGPFLLTFADDTPGGLAAIFSLIGQTAPSAGQTYILPLGAVDVGRGDDCAIAISDSSISRKHATLHVGVDELTVEDLGSSNGTFVNDARVKRHTLENGDRLRFGNVDFQVAREAPNGEPLAGTIIQRIGHADSSLKLAAAMGGMTLILLAVIASIMWMRADGGRSNPFVAYEKRIEQSMASARANAKTEAWDVAVRAFAEVLESDPIHTEARAGLLAAETNRDHKKNLEDAAVALAEKRAMDALRHLTAIPSDTFYAPRAAALTKQARAKVSATALANGRVACKKKDWQRCHYEAVMTLTHDPQSAGGQQLVKQAEENLKSKGITFTPWSSR